MSFCCEELDIRMETSCGVRQGAWVIRVDLDIHFYQPLVREVLHLVQFLVLTNYIVNVLVSLVCV